MAAQCSTDEEQRLSGCDVWLPANCDHAAKTAQRRLTSCSACIVDGRIQRRSVQGDGVDLGLRGACYCAIVLLSLELVSNNKDGLGGEKVQVQVMTECSAGGDSD